MKELKVLNTSSFHYIKKIFPQRGKLVSLLMGGRLYLYLFLLLIINVFLINLPLIKDLSYEFAVINALLLIIIPGLFYTSFFHKKEISLIEIVITGIYFLVVILIAIILGIILNGICSLNDTIKFLIVITFPSLLISISITYTISSYLKRFKYFVYFIIISIIAAIPLYEIYYNPQIYFYNSLIGFFPGNIYDEGIKITYKLIGFRILNLIYFIGAAIFSYYINLKLNHKKSKSIIIILIFPIIFLIFSDILGYSSTERSLKNDFWSTEVTEHFIIYHSNKISPKEIQVIKILQEYYYSELKLYFQCEPKNKIKSFIYYNTKEKGQLFGAENADMSKPWDNSIYTSYDSYESSLKHEIAHCFTAAFGKGILKLPEDFNNVLLEGAAMAADSVYSLHSLDYMASLAFHYNYRVSLSSLFNLSGFLGSNSSISYVYAGSFIKYLIDSYGIEKFRMLYSDIDFNKYYKKDVSSLEKEFNSYLKNKAISNSYNFSKSEADYYYGHPSIFYKKCPHYIATKTQDVFAEITDSNYAKAEEELFSLLKLSNNYSLTAGYAEVLVKQNKLSKAINFLSNRIYSFRNSSYYFNLKFKLADILALNFQINEAVLIYNEILDKKPSISLQILSLFRLRLIENESINNYLEMGDSGRFAILKNLNRDKYDYQTFFALIDLSQLLKIDYKELIKIFDKKFIVNDNISGYALAKLIGLQIENMDYNSALTNIQILKNFKSNNELNLLTKSLEQKVNWMMQNTSLILNRKY